MPFLIPGARFDFGNQYAQVALQSQNLAAQQAEANARLALQRDQMQQAGAQAMQQMALERQKFSRGTFESDRNFGASQDALDFAHAAELSKMAEGTRQFGLNYDLSSRKEQDDKTYRTERNRIEDQRNQNTLDIANTRYKEQLAREDERYKRADDKQSKQYLISNLRGEVQDAWNEMKDYENLAEKNPEAFNPDYYRQLQDRHAQARASLSRESASAPGNPAQPAQPAQPANLAQPDWWSSVRQGYTGGQAHSNSPAPQDVGTAALIKARADSLQKKAAEARQGKEKQESYRVLNEAITKLGPHLKAMSPDAARDSLNNFVKGQTGRPVDEDTLNAVLRTSHPTYNMIQEWQDKLKGLSPEEQLAQIRDTQQQMSQPYEGEGAKAISFPDPVDPRKMLKRAPTYAEYLSQQGIRPKDIDGFLRSAEQAAAFVQVAPGSGPGRPAGWDPEFNTLKGAVENATTRFRSGKAPAGGSMPYYGGNITEGATRARILAQLLADQGSRFTDDPRYPQLAYPQQNAPSPTDWIKNYEWTNNGPVPIRR